MSLLDILSLQSEDSPLSANCRTRQCSIEAALEWENHFFFVILYSSPVCTQQCCLFAHTVAKAMEWRQCLGVLRAKVTSLTMQQPPLWKPLLCASELNKIQNGVCPCLHSYSGVGKLHKLDIKTLCTQHRLSAVFSLHNIFFSFHTFSCTTYIYILYFEWETMNWIYISFFVFTLFRHIVLCILCYISSYKHCMRLWCQYSSALFKSFSSMDIMNSCNNNSIWKHSSLQQFLLGWVK